MELPPYSPQLNPTEHLWDWIRRYHLSNRTYEGYEEIVNACCESWLDLIADKNRLRSMCWFPWIKEAET
ncbi:transposase [bacterium]|nr:transposase [bacterium]MBU1153340.1 transposase [bacterium]MBU2599663.1 transposase [bacterium]